MLDRMCKECPNGDAPTVLEEPAKKIRAADGFVTAGTQAGVKNLTDHFPEERFWRPATIVNYSACPRAATAWLGTLSK